MEKRQMTKDEYEEAGLASYWNFKFKDSMVAKAPYTKLWNEYMDAYKGDYFKQNLPDYKSDLVSNYIFSIIETIRPIMLDNDPKFQSMPRQPEGMAFSNDLQDAFSYEWDREKMNRKMYRELIHTLVTGNSLFFLPWNSDKKEIECVPVSPFNIFPDPLATTVDDAEYIIYATYQHANRLKRAFPQKAHRLSGGSVNYGELVSDNERNTNVENQVLVLEVWTTDYESFEENPDGTFEQKYPKGRVITLCPELGIVLKDNANPYEDGEFPFIQVKDYDIPGKFWGEGEVSQLLSPQKYMNELNNSILDNAKTMANMPWIVDKNAGVGQGAITSRPGLIIRKNPGSEVRREQPPSMPGYVINAVETYKSDMEQVSGVFDTLKGNSETGVYTAQGILALQEAGQARVRLKVKLLEDSLGVLAMKWFSRMRQFWTEDRWVRTVRADGSYSFKELSTEALHHDYDIRISAGSTMPVNRGAMLDLMIRLAQTQMADGESLVDREAVVEYLPQEVKSALLKRMNDQKAQVNEQIMQLEQELAQLMEQFEQLTEESTSNDEETITVIEELAGGIESINEKILQLQEKHDTLETDKRKQEEIDKVSSDAYNEGYQDREGMLEAEREAQSTLSSDGNPLGNGLEEGLEDGLEEGLSEEDPLDEGLEELPDDIMQGIDGLTDEQLEKILEQYPELLELIGG